MMEWEVHVSSQQLDCPLSFSLYISMAYTEINQVIYRSQMLDFMYLKSSV